MTADARPWLPFNALSDGVLNSCFSDLAREWAMRWFAGNQGRSVRIRADYGPPPIASGQAIWRTACGELALVTAPDAQNRLAGAALGVRIPTGKVSPRDGALLGDLAAEALGDLLATAAKSFFSSSNIDPPSGREVGVGARDGFAIRFGISLGLGSDLFSVLVRPAAAVKTRKALINRPPSVPALFGCESAVAGQAVTLGARVGAGWLALEEVSSLAYGDVIVLDRKTSDMLELTINGKPLAGLACELGQDGSALRLRVRKVEDGVRT